MQKKILLQEELVHSSFYEHHPHHPHHPKNKMEPDYFGPMVNRSARVEGQAAGGQLLVSGSTWDAIEGELTGPRKDEFTWKYLGEFELKGLEGKERITQILPKAIEGRVFETESKKKKEVKKGPTGTRSCSVKYNQKRNEKRKKKKKRK